MRGISPQDLVTQVRNTIPFLFDEAAGWQARAPFVAPILAPTLSDDASLVDYYRLCLAAHHATVSSFVPTDVDNQIRLKLWSPRLPAETLDAMADVVRESRSWDCRPLSARWVESPRTGELLSGHDGEWLSTAVGAYGALRRRNPESALELAERIGRELVKEKDVFEDLVRAQDGLNALRAATLIAHNLGDFARVTEAWNLQADPALQFDVLKHPSLARASDLNKQKMALENHRHFALRRPRALRRSAALLLPLGPFLDDWGARLAKNPELGQEEVAEVAEALVDGWQTLPGTVGYARALAGIESAFAGGAAGLARFLPAKAARLLKSGPLRSLIAVPRGRFEKQWSHVAL